jgi:ATP-dependent DNA helicase RecQ
MRRDCTAKSTGVDEVLMICFVICAKKLLKKLVFHHLFFQEPSLEDMVLKKYPISQIELINIHGVGEGKSKKIWCRIYCSY